MHIGLTYDLRADYLAAGYSEEETAEFDQPATIAALQSALKTLGHQTDRIGNGRQLVQRLAAGDRWDLVFNIAEGLHGLAREAQVPAILDLYQIPYTFSDPLVMALALHKGLTKAVVRAAGVPTADFALVERIEDVDRVDLRAAAVCQAGGRGHRQRHHGGLEDPRPAGAAAGSAAELLAKYRQPVLVETFLSGREFTVGIAGTGPRAEVLGSMEVVLLPGAEAEVYSYVNKEKCEELCRYLPTSPERDEEVRQAEAVALAAYRAVGCRDAGRVDIRSDGRGRPHFIEVNPLAGLHPQHSDLPILCTMKGIDYVALIGRILDSACRRIATK